MANTSAVHMRMPAELREWLESQAEKERRNLTNMIVVMLEDHKRHLEQQASGGDAQRAA